MAGIGPPIWANRLGVGPMEKCATCKYEEFFLSSWPNGDPAMVVDFPANAVDGSNEIVLGPKATKAYYPDDPSNVYHSYVGDHAIHRILHAGANITHVHHQHAHQWLHSPNSDKSHYRDSQMISPGAAYTLEYVFNGSGNKNQTPGDSIFHCHFYPHFAEGMWALWRVHDTFEPGTVLDGDGRPLSGEDVWNRALPDGEIATGTPTPAIVPLPTIPMAPLPARVQVVAAKSPKDDATVGQVVQVNEDDLAAGKNPGYPFFIPGVAGQRAPHPPLDFAPDLDENGVQKVDGDGTPLLLDGGLPRHLVLNDRSANSTRSTTAGTSPRTTSDPVAIELPEGGTPTELAAMAANATRTHASFTPDGTPGPFVLNGMPPARGAPFADPGVDLEGNPINNVRRYKAADFELDVVFNKKGWHFPQQRITSLWGDVEATRNGERAPEPLFFRANSDEIVEYWLANLVPNYYELDDFQVRSPTDVLGQHIHLVKFDVPRLGRGRQRVQLRGWHSRGPRGARADRTHQRRRRNHAFQDPANPDSTEQRMLEAKTIPFFGEGPRGPTASRSGSAPRPRSSAGTPIRS